MAQPIKKDIKKVAKKIPKKKREGVALQKKKRKHPEYGTSKLEEKFAHEFLDKLGVDYVYQYKAESIGRYFDFRIMPRGPIIEIHGSYWHGDKRLYEEKDLNATQKKNIKVDEYKRKWCARNGIPIIYIWEYDIHNNYEKIFVYLEKELEKYIKKKQKNAGKGRI